MANRRDIGTTDLLGMKQRNNYDIDVIVGISGVETPCNAPGEATVAKEDDIIDAYC